MARRRVVITGIGIISPLGNSTAETWESAKAGRSGIGPITRFDAAAFSSRIAGEVKNFDPARYLETKEVKKHDLFSQYSIAAAQEAWDESALGTIAQPERCGCVLGVGIGGLPVLERYMALYLSEGPKKITPFLIPCMISNLAPGNVAIRFGLKGVNYTVTSACASGTHAIGEAFRMIADGLQDVMVTGGSESTITPMAVGGFCAMKALSTRNEEPQKASRPFDMDRDGFVMGEGSAILILEEYERAVQRGAKIHAEVLGYGSSCDAYHITAPSIGGEGAIACMRDALASAGLQPEQIDYINAHGTSTPANDATETTAIKTLFGDWAKNGLLVSSTKSMTGHLLGAAGAVEAALMALAIRDSIAPPTINLDHPDPACDLDYVPHKARPQKIRAAMSNSFGFGGTNASIVLGAAG